MWPLRRAFGRRNASNNFDSQAGDPKPEDIDFPSLLLQAQRLAGRLESGVHPRARHGAGLDFWQFRPALMHEPSQNIDWRQSARSDQLWVRQRELDAPQTLAIWCDTGPMMTWRSKDDLPFKRDAGLLAALALGGAALKGGENVTSVASGGKTGQFRGRQALEHLAHVLARHGADGAPRAQHAPPNSEMLIVSDFLWSVDRIETSLKDLAPVFPRLHLVCVHDPAERDLPYRGASIFTDVDQTTRHEMTVDDDLAIAYQTLMNAHLETLQHYVTSRGGSFTRMMTTDDLSKALSSLFLRLQSRKGRPSK